MWHSVQCWFMVISSFSIDSDTQTQSIDPLCSKPAAISILQRFGRQTALTASGLSHIIYSTGLYLFICSFTFQILTFGSIDSVCSNSATISMVRRSSCQTALTTSDLSHMSYSTGSYSFFCSFMFQILTFSSIDSVCSKSAAISMVL